MQNFTLGSLLFSFTAKKNGSYPPFVIPSLFLLIVDGSVGLEPLLLDLSVKFAFKSSVSDLNQVKLMNNLL